MSTGEARKCIPTKVKKKPRKRRKRSQVSIEDFDREDLIIAIRQVFSSGGGRDRETAIREIADELGFNRLGPKIREEIKSVLIAAVRRGVIENDRGELQIDCRSIDEYPQDLLREMLLGAIGQVWWKRKDAIQAAARYIGFRRVGPNIEEKFKSIIRGAIWRGLLECDHDKIRKVR